MSAEFFDDIDKKGLIHSYDPNISVPEQFVDFINKYNKTTYRSTFLVNFDSFKPYKYFIVLFVEKGSKGTIKAWGIADRTKCERVKTKYDSSSFLDAKWGFKGNKYSSFKSLFYYTKMGMFTKTHDCKELNLIKTGKPITSLTSLQTALYVEVPQGIRNELTNGLKVN